MLGDAEVQGWEGMVMIRVVGYRRCDGVGAGGGRRVVVGWWVGGMNKPGVPAN